MAASSKRRERNLDKERERMRRHYAANKEKVLIQRRLHHAANREKRCAYQRHYREVNPGAYRRWQQENPEKVAAHSQRRRARKAAATIGDPAEVAACEAEIRESRWCEKCKAEVDDLHVDHIQPLSKGGAHSVENLQGLCARHNLEKGVKPLEAVS
jgi:5-methylcytosine-specific restriction endonuclease McrA